MQNITRWQALPAGYGKGFIVTTKYPQLLLENQLCFDLYSASRRLIQSYRPYLEPLGLTYPQYLVLMVLWEYSEIGMKELGIRLELDSGTTTPLLKRMEAKGLLERIRSEIDEREIFIKITASGTRVKEKLKHLPFDLKCKAQLSDTQVNALKRKLRALNQSLQSN